MEIAIIDSRLFYNLKKKKSHTLWYELIYLLYLFYIKTIFVLSAMQD